MTALEVRFSYFVELTSQEFTRDAVAPHPLRVESSWLSPGLRAQSVSGVYMWLLPQEGADGTCEWRINYVGQAKDISERQTRHLRDMLSGQQIIRTRDGSGRWIEFASRDSTPAQGLSTPARTAAFDHLSSARLLISRVDSAPIRKAVEGALIRAIRHSPDAATLDNGTPTEIASPRARTVPLIVEPDIAAPSLPSGVELDIRD